ncbi:MAG: aromatic ring-hydroxylating dioxygenase subunit alpha [Proteobacteria bacterium]|nr:aromatic ring-hydroxylating dioxygenase subunit alpha [Pseudomonadota bacterium]
MTEMEQLLAATTANPAAGVALPFSAYREPEVFECEMERAFRGDWVAVCPAAQLPEAGDYVALSIGGEPVVVLRGRDGALRALSNVCRHRGTPILDEGCGRAGSLVCPYHAWAYADDGSFRGAPHTGNIEIDPVRHALPRFALEVWCGVVFVNVDGRAEPLAERLGDVARAIEVFGMERYDTAIGAFAPEVWRANWKLIYENGVESYHLFKVHKDTLEPVTSTRRAFYVLGDARAAITGGPIEGGTEHQFVVAVPPSFVATLTRDLFGWIAIHPEAPDRTRVVTGALVPRDVARWADRDRDAPDPLTQAFLEEDRLMCERGQQGMQSRHSRGGQLVELERIVGDFHQYLGARLFDQAPAPVHRERGVQP